MARLQVSGKTLKNINLPPNFKEAIAQYVWNGFEAGASKVNIVFDTSSEIGHIDSFKIIDNGEGINHSNLKRNFGYLLDSTKKRSKESSLIQGGKGRGRLSFLSFADKAKWNTCYDSGEDERKKYEITIDAKKSNEYKDSKPKKTEESLGTEVEFFNPTVNVPDLESSELKDLLVKEFAWYLYLHSQNNYQILINDKALDCSKIFGDTEDFTLRIKDDDEKEHNFDIKYIRWSEKIKEQSYFYYLTSEKEERFKKLTSFNKVGGGAYGFFHSVYVSSKYFDHFDSRRETEEQATIIKGHNRNDRTYRELNKELHSFLTEKRKQFYKRNADLMLGEFEKRETVPEFGEDKYGQQKKEDFKTVFKEIYLVEPTIFYNLNPSQEKTFLSMLSLLLDSDERENILKLVDGIVELTKEERAQLAQVLDKTSLRRIIRTIKMLENRFEVIESLKVLVFENTKFTRERGHIQEIISSNYWLFGEQFHLVSEDEAFETLLKKYLAFIESKPSASEKKTFNAKNSGSKKRPDIFLCRKRKIPDVIYNNDDEIDENIIVELKRPSVTIGIDEHRQIEDYLRYVFSKPEFNSKKLRSWKFYLVGISIEDDVKGLYKNHEHHGKRFLTFKVDNCEVYVYTWDDLFQSVETRHRFILDKLNYNKQTLLEHLELNKVESSVELANEITEKVAQK